MSENYSGRCKHGAMPNHCQLCDRERIAELDGELAEAQAKIDTAISMISEGLETDMPREQVLIDVENMLKGGRE